MTMKMRIPGPPLIEGVFLQRPNRFLSKIQVNGQVVWSHVPDPGRLKELLVPGARVLVQPKNTPQGKTKYATVMVYQEEELISINSQLPNRFIRFCLDNSLIPELETWQVAKQEYTLGRSRFDFLLSRGKKQKLLEIKSVTLVEQGVARFPDAVTARGARHVSHLAESIDDTRSAAVLFLIQRADAHAFEPHWGRDPFFAESLNAAVKKGVDVYAYSTHLTPEYMSLGKPLKINLEPES